MNIRKPIDYSVMYAALDTLMIMSLPQMKSASSSVPDWRKALLLPLPNTLARHILISKASPPETSVGCGIFTELMRMLQRCWPRP